MNKKKPELKYEKLRGLYDEACSELTDCLQRCRAYEDNLRYLNDFIHCKQLDDELQYFREHAHEEESLDNPFPRLII